MIKKEKKNTARNQKPCKQGEKRVYNLKKLKELIRNQRRLRQEKTSLWVFLLVLISDTVALI